MSPDSWSTRDRTHIWHPFTQAHTAPIPITIARGQGAYLYSETGQPIWDGISSWWVNLHGHAHPEIAAAIAQQAHTLEHVIFAGCTHEWAVRLAEKLYTGLPPNLSRFFFSDNGSTAVEVALKMAYQRHWNHGKPETCIFLAFEGGYHGDTFGAMSVGKSAYHTPFKRFFFETRTCPYPATWWGDPDLEAKEAQAWAVLERHLDEVGPYIAGLILEPLIQGASGMRCARPEFLRRVCQRVRDQGICLIFDEVMTGFGRTGTCFAWEQLGIVPDLLCLSKGLTGGFVPLALTITHDTIYQAFLGETAEQALLHGHSYTANPIGCRAALASWDILQRPATRQAIQEISAYHPPALAALQAAYPAWIYRIRNQGTIAAFELAWDIQQIHRLRDLALTQGIFLRPLGSVVYWMPPYCSTTADLEQAYGVLHQLIGTLAPFIDRNDKLY